MLSEAAPQVVQRTRELCNTFDGLFLVLIQIEGELHEAFSNHDPKTAVELSNDAGDLRSHITTLDYASDSLALFARDHERILGTLQRFNSRMTAVIDYAERRKWKLKRQDISYDGQVIAQEIYLLQTVAQSLTPTHLTMQRHFAVVFDAAPAASTFGQRILKAKSFEALSTARDEYFQDASAPNLKRYIELAEAGVTFEYAWEFSRGNKPQRESEYSALAEAILAELIRDELFASVLNDREESSRVA